MEQKPWRLLAMLAGLALALYLLVKSDLPSVLAALRIAGWSSLGGILLVHVVPTVLGGIAWWLLLARQSDEGWPLFAWLRCLRDGLDGIIPILPISGELVSARMLAKRGVPMAGASIIVDLTAELLSLVLFALIGLAILARQHPPGAPLYSFAAVVLAMAAQFVGFLYAQRKGLFRLIDRSLARVRRAKDDGNGSERRLHREVQSLYEDRRGFLACMILHLGGWLSSAFEIWIALYFMGSPVSVAQAVALEGLVLACRSVAFLIPLGAGIQEAGYVLVGGLFGLPPDIALAVSLLKRARDVLLGAPALLVWQGLETRALRRSLVLRMPRRWRSPLA
jgi:putative membrane protein